MLVIFFGILALACTLVPPADGRLFDGLLEDASDKGLDYMASLVTEDGHWNDPDAQEDVWFYYKLPLVLFLGGRLREANLILDHIKTNFMQPDGDFKTSPDLKSSVRGSLEYYTYPNSYIVLAAQRMERYDVAAPGLRYLEQYFDSFPTNGPPCEGHTSTDPMTASFLGTLAMAAGDKKAAKRAAKLIEKFIDLQPDWDLGFYYKIDNGELITEFDASLSMVYFLNRTAPHQHFLEIALPAAYLATYYRQTGKERYLRKATDLLYWLMTCDESMYIQTTSSQKIAVASSLVGRLTQDVNILEMAERASDFLLSMQNEDGSFFDPITRRPSASDEVPFTLRTVDSTL